MKQELADLLRRLAQKLSPLKLEDYQHIDGYRVKRAQFGVTVGAGKLAYCQQGDPNARKVLIREAEYQVSQKLLKQLHDGAAITFQRNETTNGVTVTGEILYAGKRI